MIEVRSGIEQQALAVDERLIAVAALPEAQREQPSAGRRGRPPHRVGGGSVIDLPRTRAGDAVAALIRCGSRSS